jgi:hypothetical protein
MKFFRRKKWESSQRTKINRCGSPLCQGSAFWCRYCGCSSHHATVRRNMRVIMIVAAGSKWERSPMLLTEIAISTHWRWFQLPETRQARHFWVFQKNSPCFRSVIDTKKYCHGDDASDTHVTGRCSRNFPSHRCLESIQLSVPLAKIFMSAMSRLCLRQPPLAPDEAKARI